MSLAKVGLGLALIASLMLGGGMLVSTMDHHDMGGCVFMVNEPVVCGMSAIDHIAAWQSAFAAVAPTLLLLALLTCVYFIIVSRVLALPEPVPILSRSVYRTRRKITPPLQELFARGILHPKLF